MEMEMEEARLMMMKRLMERWKYRTAVGVAEICQKQTVGLLYGDSDEK